MARPARYTTRSQLGWPATSGGNPASPRSGLVIHYDSANQGLADKAHSACEAYWKNTRSFHMGPSRGWADIGYSFFCCPHSYVLEGRGLDRAQAAQPGGNTSHYSVTLATGPGDAIPAAQINAVRALRAWLMGDQGVAGTVLGHRDFISTSCPGDRAYRMVQDGTFTKSPDETGDDMPEHDRYTWGDQDPVPLVKGEWRQMRYGARNGDTDNGPHYSLAGISSSAMLYDLSAGFRIEGLEPGAEYQTRLAVYDPPEDGGSWTRARALRTQEHKHGLGDAFNVHNDKGRVNAAQRVRLEILIHTDSPDARVIKGSCDNFYWKL